MKDTLTKIAISVWKYANSNIGAALIGAAGAYILTKGHRENEIEDTRVKLKLSEETILKIQAELKEADKKLFDLFVAKTDTALRLESCLRKNAFLVYTLKNTSFCLFRPVYSTEAEEIDIRNLNNKEKNQSFIKNTGG